MRNGIAVAALLLAPLAGMAQPASVAREALQREAFQKVCGACHSVDTVTSQRRTRAQWQESITSMVARGAKGTDEEFAAILDYLTVQYGPSSPAAAARRRGAGGAPRHSLPDLPINR